MRPSVVGLVDVSVILPTFNERESLPRVVREVHEALAGIPHEILVVDDDSPDQTWQWVEAAAQTDQALRLLRRMTNHGLSAAVLDGLQAARGEKCIVMDADGQHDPKLLPQVSEALTAYELVVASRYRGGGGTGRWNPLRWLASRMATWFAQLLLNVSLTDPMSGFFGVRRAAFCDVAGAMDPRGFKVLLELYYRLNRRPGAVRCGELPYQFRGRLAGTSKLSGHVIREYVQQVLVLRGARTPQGLLKFAAVGALGAVANCGILWWLMQRHGWHYLAAAPLAIELSIVHNFFWHDRWTFKDRRRLSPWRLRFLRYQWAALAGLGVNWLILAVGVEGLGWPVLAANLCGIAGGTVLNFSISKLWAWRRESSGLALSPARPS